MVKVLRIPENTKGRDFVVGDIHGMYDLLDAALEAASFDTAKDRVICTGDLINRGTRSADCIKYLAQPWFIAQSGNHEEMFGLVVDADGSVNGFLDSYRDIGLGWVERETKETLKAIYAAFKELPYAMEMQTPDGLIGFVHAEAPLGMSWAQFTYALAFDDPDAVEKALWGTERIREKDESGVDGVIRVFCGHKPQKQGVINLGNVFYMDTNAVEGFLKGRFNFPGHLTLAFLGASAEDLTRPVLKQPKNFINVIAPGLR